MSTPNPAYVFVVHGDRFLRGWWCSRGSRHEGPCALRPRWWNLPARIRCRGLL